MNSGKQLNQSIEHSIEIVEIALNQSDKTNEEIFLWIEENIPEEFAFYSIFPAVDSLYRKRNFAR